MLLITFQTMPNNYDLSQHDKYSKHTNMFVLDGWKRLYNSNHPSFQFCPPDFLCIMFNLSLLSLPFPLTLLIFFTSEIMLY